ncbi:G patch domain-containing protein 1 isoform X3 [Nelusetta ayraudi]|uniref:G patch domain-containing protein 1 isoform X3 n=1 Tax=Nelusetta ayraudi TaxID=303726 RepID=UPI003F6FDFC5
MASDSDSEEDFVTYGTPLEPLEEDEPLRKPIPLHEQTVKDEKGRYQRFHGAFTGGFSAGYFNTVGTKEGWTPSTFVSSRQQKAEKHQAGPEDFMDEEDLSEHGIAPRGITTSQEFTSGRRDELRDKARAINAQAALIPGDTLLEELIAPARLSIGVELLKKMGWKEGQGVGPRVKRRARRQQPEGSSKVYGCALPLAGSEDSEEDDDDDEFAPENVTFAPKDVTPLDFNPKLGVQGLGYRGLDPGLALHGRGAREHINLFDPQSDARSQLFGGADGNRRRRGVAGQAFGVGALEDEDEDIYHRDSMSKYDTVLGGEEPGDGLFGWTAPELYSRKKDKSRDGSYLGKILEGFTLAQKDAEEKTIFPPPVLPKDFRPVRRLRPSVDVLRLSGTSPALAEALRTSRGHMVKEEPQQGGGRHQLDSGRRRNMLGEDSLQGPSSVLDLLRPEDRERLRSLRNSSAQPDASAPPKATPAAAGLPAQGGPAASTGLQEEALAAWRDAKSSSQAFRPFEKEPSKQARYELYLSRLRQGDRDALEQSLDLGQTEWERSRERDEFARASILYRPSSSSLSSRFTRAQHGDNEDRVERSKDQEDDKESSSKDQTTPGKPSRETLEWHPDKLLCKRFNVPDPFPGSSLVGVPKLKRDKFSVFDFLTVVDGSRGSAPPAKPVEPAKRSRWDVSAQSREQQQPGGTDPLSELLTAARKQADHQGETGSAPSLALPAPGDSSSTAEQSSGPKKTSDGGEVKQEEEEEEEEEEESRPSMDLFKAIFAGSSDETSSSSDGEEEQEEEQQQHQEEEAATPHLFNIAPTVAPTVAPSVSSSARPQTDGAPSSQSSRKEEEGEEFGPKLPPPSAAPPSRQTEGATSISYPPKEEQRHRKRSKEKKHKNKKQHKHKKEKKKKKQKQHKSKGKEPRRSKKEVSDSDEESDGGVGQMSALQILQRLKNIPTHHSC